jgi:uncharacterized protein YjaG (DUF416 family)
MIKKLDSKLLRIILDKDDGSFNGDYNIPFLYENFEKLKEKIFVDSPNELKEILEKKLCGLEDKIKKSQRSKETYLDIIKMHGILLGEYEDFISQNNELNNEHEIIWNTYKILKENNYTIKDITLIAKMINAYKKNIYKNKK